MSKIEAQAGQRSIPSTPAELDFASSYSYLLSQYDSSKQPVAVDFRKLVPVRSGADRYTHLIHSYPAKLLPNIPLFFLNCSTLTKPNDLVWDPFCGTGTSLLEAVLAGKRAAGADANPLARMITQVKLTKLSSAGVKQELHRIKLCCRDLEPAVFQPVTKVERWFSEHAIRDLGQLKASIDFILDEDIARFFLICLSAIIRKCSIADPRLSVPVRRRDAILTYRPPTFELFEETVQKNSHRVSSLDPISDSLLQSISIQSDAREPDKNNELHDLIITSPPYVGAQKYIRASSLSIGWLRLAPDAQLRLLEKQNIGREHFSCDELITILGIESSKLRQAISEIAHTSPIRAHITMTYFREMTDAIRVMHSRLKSDGTLVLITGDNTIAGRSFPTSYFLKEIAVKAGFEVELELIDDIPSRGLMTKRNRATAIIAREHICVLRKQ